MTRRLTTAIGLLGVCLAIAGCDGKAPGRADQAARGGSARTYDDAGAAKASAPAADESPQAGPSGTPEVAARPEPTEPEGDAEVQTPDGQAAPASAMDERKPGLYLVEAGAEPRTKLTLSADKGTKTTLPVTLDMRLALGVGNKDVPPTQIPTVTLDAIAEVTAAKAGGRTLTLTTANVAASDDVESARVAKALQDAVAQLGRASATIAFDATGTTTVTLEGSADTTRIRPSLDGLFDNLAPTFMGLPLEPVGKGAKWELVTHREEGGAKIQQVIRYTLDAAPGDTFTVSWELDRGTISATLPDGAGVEAHGAKGKGTMEFDPARAAAREAQAQINSRTEARVNFGESPSRVVVHQLSNLSVANG